VPPTPVLAPGSALGSRPRVALSSAQAPRFYLGLLPGGNSRLGCCGCLSLGGPASRRGRRQIAISLPQIDVADRVAGAKDDGPLEQSHGAAKVLAPVQQGTEGVKGGRMIGLTLQNSFINRHGPVDVARRLHLPGGLQEVPHRLHGSALRTRSDPTARGPQGLGWGSSAVLLSDTERHRTALRPRSLGESAGEPRSSSARRGASRGRAGFLRVLALSPEQSDSGAAPSPGGFGWRNHVLVVVPFGYRAGRVAFIEGSLTSDRAALTATPTPH